MNTFIDINNKIIDSYLRENFNLGQINNDLNTEYDLLITDNLNNYNNNIKSKKKVFIASSSLCPLHIESPNQDYDFYINFGEVHKLNEIFFEPSTTIEGFIYNDKLENKFDNKEFDVLIVSSHNCEDNDLEATLFLQFLDLLSYSNLKLKIGTNIQFKQWNKFDNCHQNNIKNIEFLDYYLPLKHINNSHFVYFLSFFDSLALCDTNIFKKCIFNDINSSGLYEISKYYNFIKKQRTPLNYQFYSVILKNISQKNNIVDYYKDLIDVYNKNMSIIFNKNNLQIYFEQFINVNLYSPNAYLVPQVLRKLIRYFNSNNKNNNNIKYFDNTKLFHEKIQKILNYNDL